MKKCMCVLMRVCISDTNFNVSTVAIENDHKYNETDNSAKK